MKGLISIICLLIACASGAPNSRIVGGEDAKLGDFPYIISFRIDGFHNCGGSIISDEYILTAAHCSIASVQTMSIQYGRLNISSKIDDSVIEVAEAILHENYNHPIRSDDIALLRLKSKIKFDENVAIAKLPGQGEPIPAGTDVQVAGWGSLSFDRNPTQLQKVNIQIVDLKQCQKSNTDPVYETNVCAGVPEGGKGECNGDSGGPLSLNDKVVGIVSWSRKPCTSKGFPGVYTRVASYRNWIRKNSGI